jgi:hypothetical protein
MYKKFTLDEIKNVRNDFIPHLYNIIKKEKCQWINDLVKFIFKEWNEVYFFERWDAAFKIAKRWKWLELTDEKERIQITIPLDDKSKLQWLIKTYIIKKERQLWQRTIEQILFDEFKTGQYNTINGKPYIVYDIETTVWAWNNLDSYKFLLAYSMRPGNEKMDYKYIDGLNLTEFWQKLLDFDWYIIGFNSFAFDNPITMKQWWFSKEEIKIIDKKSLDIFYFIRNITWKRIGLNKVSEAFIWITKTLESWTEWEVLRKKYQDTWDESFLNEFKKYCKNDVRMTAFVLLYLLHFKKIFIEWEEKTFEIEDFIRLAKPKDNIKEDEQEKWFNNQSIFE